MQYFLQKKIARDVLTIFPDRQVEYHEVKSFADEYQEFIDRFGFTRQAEGTIREKR